eukprot:m.151167 g.151167  ORF g.151167 m.151167 type:complete len:1190 (-) comp16334_c0_seq1:87-3656(-)
MKCRLALATLLVLTTRASSTLLNTGASNVFVPSHGLSAFAISGNSLKNDNLTLYMYRWRQQTSRKPSWCLATSISVDHHGFLPETTLTSMSWLSNSLILTLNNRAYVIQDNNGTLSFLLDASRSLTVMMADLEGWQADGDELILLSRNGSDHSVLNLQLDANNSWTVVNSSSFPAYQPTTPRWFGQHFVVWTQEIQLYLMRTPSSPTSMLVKGDLGRVGPSRRWFQTQHVIGSSSACMTAISHFPEEFIEVDRINGTSSVLEGPLHGRFGAQMAFEEELLAVSFEPYYNNQTYLLLYHVDADSIQPLAYRQIFYQAADWQRQGGQVTLTAGWLAVQSTPSTADYEIMSVSNSTQPGFDWSTIGMTRAGDFLVALAPKADALRVLFQVCHCANSIRTYLGQIVRTGGYILTTSRYLPSFDNQSMISINRPQPMTCMASDQVVVLRTGSNVEACEPGLTACAMLAEADTHQVFDVAISQVDSYVLYAQHLTFAPYINLTLAQAYFPSGQVSRWILPVADIPLINTSIGFGDRFTLCQSFDALYVVTLMYSEDTMATANHTVAIIKIPLGPDHGFPILDNITFVTVPVLLAPTAVGLVHMVCSPDQSAVYLNSNLDTALTQINLDPAVAVTWPLSLPSSLQHGMSWHRQFVIVDTSENGPVLVTTARRANMTQDLLMLVTMQNRAVVGYVPCQRCHRPMTATNSLVAHGGAVTLLEGSLYKKLHLFSKGALSSDWTKIDDNVTNFGPSSGTHPANTLVADSCTAPVTVSASVTSSIPPTTATSKPLSPDTPSLATSSSTAEFTTSTSDNPKSTASAPLSHSSSSTASSASTKGSSMILTSSSVNSTARVSSSIATSIGSTTTIKPRAPLSTSRNTALLIALVLTGGLCLLLVAAWIRRCYRKRQLVAFVNSNEDFLKADIGDAEHIALKNDSAELDTIPLLFTEDLELEDAWSSRLANLAACLASATAFETEVARCQAVDLDLNQPIHSNLNVLQLAVIEDQLHAVQTLVKYQACSFNVVDDRLQSVLHLAVARDLHPMLHYLLSVTSPALHVQADQRGDTCLHLAARCNSVEAVEMMAEIAPTYVLTLSQHRQNILHVAALEGSEEVINWVLHQGASLLACEQDLAELPHDLAKEGGYDKCEHILHAAYYENCRENESTAAMTKRVTASLKTRRHRGYNNGHCTFVGLSTL